MLNKNSHIPLYVQLSDILRNKIYSGEIKVGDKLPSESEMIKEYNLGRLTIRDALSILVNEGLIEKKHGKGTFCKISNISKNYRIDVLLNLDDIYFCPYYLRSICGVLENKNVNIILSDTCDNADTIANHIEKAIQNGSDGIVFQPSSNTKTAPENLKKLLLHAESKNIPYIMIDTFYENVAPSYVVMDEIQAGKMVGEYFTRLGHSSLCAVYQDNRIDSLLRLEGFCNALSNEPYKINYNVNFKDSLKELINKHNDITGIFCYHENIAKECYGILKELSVSIPDDISVISVDDTIIASTLSPALTTIIHPKEYIGDYSARAMLDIIRKETSWPYKKVFEPSMAIRKSCREQL